MMTGRVSPGPATGKNLLAGALLGLGIAAFVDEAVFHQLLHWHHFYDRSTTAVGLISDGLFHAFGWFATVAALFLYADLRRWGSAWPVRFWAGVLIGAGAFQLYDGTIDHKLLRVHQIRYRVDIVPYDLAWDIVAAVILVAGVALLVGSQRAQGSPPLSPGDDG